MSQRQIRLNPDLKQATWEQIKTKREEFKRAPITTTVGTFDVDDVSFQNITIAISSFTAISDPQTNTINWKLFDNTIVAVTEADLIEVRNSVATRANHIHTMAEVLNGAGHLVKDINDTLLWGL